MGAKLVPSFANLFMSKIEGKHVYTYPLPPHNEGISAIKKLLATYRQLLDLSHSSYTVGLLRVVLTNNDFEFKRAHYHQVSGTAMGAKLVPSFANLFMSKIEGKHVYTYPLPPNLWKKVIDDIF